MAIPFLNYGEKRIERRKDMSPAELALEEHQHLSFLTNLGLAVALILGFAVIWLHVHTPIGGTAATAAYGAALGSGGILGFLFGVPGGSKAPVTVNNARGVAIGTGNEINDPQGSAAVQLPQGAATPDDTAPPKPNTSNLEQVADWVTKLLLGGGLTQMQRIPPLIWRWAQIVGWGIIGDDPKVTPQRMLAEQSFGAGLLVYGFLLGFFSGYLITKLQLGKAISE